MTLVCIECPNGCRMEAVQDGGAITVTGNKCPRGAAFFSSELNCPMRTLCSTVRTVFPEAPVLSVRVDREIPKARIFDVMRAINAITLTERLGIGGVVIENVCGLGVNVVITDGILLEV